MYVFYVKILAGAGYVTRVTVVATDRNDAIAKMEAEMLKRGESETSVIDVERKQEVSL